MCANYTLSKALDGGIINVIGSHIIWKQVVWDIPREEYLRIRSMVVELLVTVEASAEVPDLTWARFISSNGHSHEHEYESRSTRLG